MEDLKQKQRKDRTNAVISDEARVFMDLRG